MSIEYRYIDIIWLDNLIMNFVLLYITAIVVKNKDPKWRLWLASALGAFYALAHIIIDCPLINNFGIKILVSILMVGIGFQYNTLGKFLKILGTFYGITFLFGGGAFGIYYLTEDILSIRKGRFYIEGFPAKVLFISTILIITLIHILWPRIKKGWVKGSLIYKIVIQYGDSKINLNGLLDTGNSLCDPLTQRPIIIVEYDAVKGILPKYIENFFAHEGDMNLEFITDHLEYGRGDRFRLIPYYALGKSQGILLGIKVDRAWIHFEDIVVDDVGAYIGIYNQELSVEGDYKALIHPELVYG